MNLLKFCKDLYRIPRSITGEGIVKTLKYIQNIIPIEIKTVKSGTKVFDWIIPPEWNINDAYVVELNSGKKVIDFQSHNLHVVGYSIPIDSIFTFEELEKNLYYLEGQPEAIPYITSYYSKKWGFCLSYKQFNKLDRNSKYKVVIDSSFNENGSLTYGELLIKGQSEEEIFFSSYICHSQMANNELSGPAVLSAIAEKFQVTDNYFSMRFILIPETIGSLAYLSENLKELKKNVIAGFNISCVGDERMWGYLPSRKGDSYTDKVAKFVLKQEKINYKSFSWIDDRGSDERQYCMPGVDLPLVCITRSKWDEYEEYHTSLDDFNLVTEKGLNESLKLYLKIIETINTNHLYKTNVIGEPQLGRRNLYPKVSDKKTWQKVKNLINIISFCDGENDLIDICELLKIQYSECVSIIKLYESLDLIEIKPKNLNK